MTQGLPDEQRAAIEQRYAHIVAEVQEEEAAAQAQHQQTLDGLRAQEAQALAAAGAQEETARQQLAALVTERQTLREQAARYTGITMRAMLLHMPGGDVAGAVYEGLRPGSRSHRDAPAHDHPPQTGN